MDRAHLIINRQPSQPKQVLHMMLQCPQLPENNCNTATMAPAADMAILETQSARLNYWLQQQVQHQSHFPAALGSLPLHPSPFSVLPASTTQFHTTAFGGGDGSITHDLSMSLDLVRYPVPGGTVVCGGSGGSAVKYRDGTVPRTFSCSPMVGDAGTKAAPSASAASDEIQGGGAATPASTMPSADRARESYSKRKARELPEEDDRDLNGDDTDALVEPKLEIPLVSRTAATTTTTTNSNKDKCDNTSSPQKEFSTDISKGKSKVSGPPPKSDYIHVRARRGQATDSHSLAERVRREKISKRMKLLQDLVPGCHKITGKAGVLDEIINYVQSLQRQVEFLSMKLAAASPTLDFNIDTFFSKENFPVSGDGFPPLMAMLPPELLDESFLLHFNTMQTQQAMAASTSAVKCGGLEVAICSSSPSEQAALLCPTSSAPPSACGPFPFQDLYKVQALAMSSPWEADSQCLYSIDDFDLQQGLGRGAPTAAAAAAATPNF